MARTLTTAVQNQLATNDIRPIHLISIGFSTPVNITDNAFDLTSSVSGSSKTYLSSSFLVSIPSFTEQTDVTKSSLNPPGYVFGIVWPILYLFMSISAYRVFEKIYKLFFIQLFFNTIWSWLFFASHLPVIALLDIWLLIFLNVKITIILFKTDRVSTFLYIPYVLWLCFASYLNLFIVVNN